MSKRPAKSKADNVPELVDGESADVRRFELSAPDMRRIGTLVGADVDATPEEMLELGTQDFCRASKLMVRSGWYLLAVKESVGHGQFSQALESRDIDPRRAREVMRFAYQIHRLPADQAERLLSLQPSKAIALANADPDVVDEIMEGDDEADFSELSVREMKARIKEIEQRKVNVDTQNAELTAENKQLKAALLNKEQTSHLPGPCLIARHEAAALSQQIIQAVEAMEDTYTRQVLSPVVLEDERIKAIALNSVYHALAGAAARCYGFIDRLQKEHGDTIGGMDQLMPFTEDEVERLVEARRLLVAEHNQDAEQRKQERAAAQPKRRGRPRHRIEGDE